MSTTLSTPAAKGAPATFAASNALPAKRRKWSLPLSVRLSGLLVLVAILPLLITVSTVELLSRPSLITRTAEEMETDARTRAQLIDNYFSERILEAESLSRLPAIQQYLAGDTTLEAKAHDGLATGHGRGSLYEDWSLYNLNGDLRLFYPTKPQLHGPYYILPEVLQQVHTLKKALVSNIFYNSVSNEAYIDIYTPVVTASYAPVGILRTSFDLHYIWQIVDDEAGANGSGSYAFIADEHGVLIAYTNPHPDPTGLTHAPDLFKAVAPLPPQTLSQISSEGLYKSGGQLTVLNDTTLASMQQGQNLPPTFQFTPAGQNQVFQAARSTTYTVPWNYYVLSPLSTVTATADQQLLIAGIITLLVAVVAALIGLGVGQRMTLPILSSVKSLLSSSRALKTLSSTEQNTADEQYWVVEASQTGMKQVLYLNQATDFAASRMSEISAILTHHWQYLNTHPEERERILQEIVSTTRYIDRAVKQQRDSGQDLAAAIRVTAQVSKQLIDGATSAAQAAEQLEEVVNQLRAVVGK